MKPGNLTPRLYFLRKKRELRKLGATEEDLKKLSDYEKSLRDVAKRMEESNDEYIRVVDSYQKSEWFYMKRRKHENP